ncbi:MAG: hypothetical protein OEW12_08240, partial [Deltaproteobacteria bacterium]|nr:hypothetical protein [Deltaproteobacteria bacterium]
PQADSVAPPEQPRAGQVPPPAPPVAVQPPAGGPGGAGIQPGRSPYGGFPPPPGGSSQPAPAAKSIIQPVYANESYRVAIQTVAKSGDTLTVDINFEAVTRDLVPLLFQTGAYVLDENGKRWDQREKDSAGVFAYCCELGIELVPTTKRRVRLVFHAREGADGTLFTLVAKEVRPKRGRTIVVPNIQLNPPAGAAPR